MIYLCIIGFAFAYYTNLKYNDWNIWWHDIRPIFGLIYLLFGLSAISGFKYAYMLLFIDVIIGIYSYLIFKK